MPMRSLKLIFKIPSRLQWQQEISWNTLRKLPRIGLKNLFKNIISSSITRCSLVSLLYAVIDEESFDIDPASETLRLKSNFLRDTEDSIEAINDDLGSIVQKERLENIKSLITEKVNEAAVKNKERKLSVGSKDGRKRSPSTDVSGERASSRSRPGSTLSSSS